MFWLFVAAFILLIGVSVYYFLREDAQDGKPGKKMSNIMKPMHDISCTCEWCNPPPPEEDP